MTNSEMIEKLKTTGWVSVLDMKFITNALEENTKLKSEIERLKAEIEQWQSTNLELVCELTRIECENNQLKSELEQSVKLPCKVGDKLFSIENGYIKKFKIRSLSQIVNLVEFNRFDETVFITREEAELALKGQVEE